MLHVTTQNSSRYINKLQTNQIFHVTTLCSQVDRSAAYAARWVAKSLVKAGLCRRCLVQVSYAIGVAEPLSVTVMDYGTSSKSNEELTKIVRDNFDLRPGEGENACCH